MTRYVPTGTYMGEELQGRSARTGAYDAMAIPSRMGDRRLSPAEMRAELHAPLPAAPAPAATPAPALATPTEQAPPPVATTAPRPVFKLGRSQPQASAQPRALTPRKDRGITAYCPRHGSVPHVLIEHLRANGGCVTYSAAAAITGAKKSSLSAICKPALLGGALVRHRVDGDLVLALGGWMPPTPAAAPPALTTAAAMPEPSRTPSQAPNTAPLAAAVAASIATLNTSLAEAVRAYERAGQALAQLQADLQAHQGAVHG